MITAKFENNESGVTVKDDVWQWDYGQVLQVEGLEVDNVTELDFATSTSADYAQTLAAVKIADTVMQVTIPDEYFASEKKQDYKLYVWIYVTDGNSGETTHTITIPVKSRPAREDWEGETGTTDPFADAIAAVNQAASAANAAAESAEEAASELRQTVEQVEINRGNIEALQTDLTALEARVTQNEEDIATNKENIATNTENIEIIQNFLDALGLSVVSGMINITYEEED